MQTFILYRGKRGFKKTARALDWRRLGKQRVEAKTILNIILKRPSKDGQFKTGWRNHVCTKQWRQFPNALKYYYNCIVKEWIRRGYKNNMELEKVDKNEIEHVPFLYCKKFITRQRQNMISKDQLYYSKIPGFEHLEPKQGYYWYINDKSEYFGYFTLVDGETRKKVSLRTKRNEINDDDQEDDEDGSFQYSIFASRNKRQRRDF